MGSCGGVVLNKNYGTVVAPDLGVQTQINRQNSARRHLEGVWIYSLFPPALF